MSLKPSVAYLALEPLRHGDGSRVNLLALGLGGSLPLHAGAVTRAILAFEPREFWDE